MLIAKIKGGLGNQMFQYAFIKALSLRNKMDFKLDLSPYRYYKLWPYELENFCIEKRYAKINEIPFYERYYFNNRYLLFASEIFNSIFIKLNKNHILDDNLGYYDELLYKNSGYFDGYFQCEKYFKDFRNEIRKDFVFSKSLSKKNNDLINSLNGKETVSIHVRRGDYLKLSNMYNICGKDYYEKGIKYVKDKIEKPVFVFFSDDSSRVKKNFEGEHYIYVDWNKGKDSRQDMALMSQCKHNIIANSSFSRWGAWLNRNPEKIVIAPKNWGKVCNKDINSESRITF